MYFFFDSYHGKSCKYPFSWTQTPIGRTDYDCTYTREQIELLAESQAKTKKEKMLGLKPGKELSMFKLHRTGYLVLYRMTDKEIEVWKTKKSLKEEIQKVSAEIYERTRDLQERKRELERMFKKCTYSSTD
jgi:hypothetical protein